MKKIIFFLSLLLLTSLISCAQTVTGTFKTGKLQLNIPDRTTDTIHPIVVWDSITKMTKAISRKDFLKGVHSPIPTLQQVVTAGYTLVDSGISLSTTIDPHLGEAEVTHNVSPLEDTFNYVKIGGSNDGDQKTTLYDYNGLRTRFQEAAGNSYISNLTSNRLSFEYNSTRPSIISVNTSNGNYLMLSVPDVTFTGTMPISVNGQAADSNGDIAVSTVDSTAVKLVGDQTVAGVKTFTDGIATQVTGSVIGFATQVLTQNSSNNVDYPVVFSESNSGTPTTIHANAGGLVFNPSTNIIKVPNATFSGSVQVPTATLSTQAINKGQLDSVVSSTQFWTATGSDIQNNNVGDVDIKLANTKLVKVKNASDQVGVTIGDGLLTVTNPGNSQQYSTLTPLNLSMNRLQAGFNFAVGNPQISQPFSETSTNYFGTSYVAGSNEVSGVATAEHSFNIGNSVGDGITSGIFRIGRARLQSTVPVKYATDLSGSYDARTLVDRAYVDSAVSGTALGFTPENIANKSNSYIASSTITYPNTKALVDGLATKQPIGSYLTSVPTLQQVTTTGAVTSTPIQINGIQQDTALNISFSDEANGVVVNTNTSYINGNPFLVLNELADPVFSVSHNGGITGTSVTTGQLSAASESGTVVSAVSNSGTGAFISSNYGVPLSVRAGIDNTVNLAEFRLSNTLLSYIDNGGGLVATGLVSNSLTARNSDILTLTSGGTTLAIDDTNSTVTADNSNIVAASFIKQGGTSTQTLMADGNTKEISSYKIDEGNGLGTVFGNQSRTFYGNIGLDAIDFSYSDSTSSTLGATGESSFNTGISNTASGYNSTNFGYLNTNASVGGFIAGTNNQSTGFVNSILGAGNNVTGTNITVVGQAANIISESTASNNIATSPVFVVGNGTITDANPDYPVATRSDALIVRKNGVVEAPSQSIAEITAGTNKTLITKEYLDSSISGVTASTNLTYSASPTDGAILSDTGTDATIPLADGTNAGLITPAEKSKIASSITSYTETDPLAVKLAGTNTMSLNSRLIMSNNTSGGIPVAISNSLSYNPGIIVNSQTATAMGVHVNSYYGGSGFTVSSYGTACTAFSNSVGTNGVGFKADTNSNGGIGFYSNNTGIGIGNVWNSGPSSSADLLQIQKNGSLTAKINSSGEITAPKVIISGATATDVLIANGTTAGIKTINGLSVFGTGNLIVSGTASGANLSYTASSTNGLVNSDTGLSATIPLSDGVNAGLMSPLDYSKLYSREKNVFYDTDFLSATNNPPFTAAAITSGTNVANIVNMTGDHPGVVRMTSSTTANGGYRWMTDLTSMRFKGGETFTAVISPLNFATTTVRIGFHDATTITAPVDGAYLEYSNSGVLTLKTANNSTVTTSPTIATLSLNTWYKLKITVNSNATSILGELFDASGTLISSQSNTTNIPTASGREFGAGVIATESTVTATTMLDLDYLGISYKLVR